MKAHRRRQPLDALGLVPRLLVHDLPLEEVADLPGLGLHQLQLELVGPDGLLPPVVAVGESVIKR